MITVQCCCGLTSAKQQRDKERERDVVVKNIKTSEFLVSFIFHKKTNQPCVNCFVAWTDDVIVKRFGMETTPTSTLFCPLSHFLADCE